MPQDRPCWLLSSEQQGRQIMAPSPESTSVHDGFFSEGSPVPFRAPPHPWTLSAGFSSSLFPSIFKLRGLPRESPRQNSQVLIPGDSWGPWKRQLCGSLSPPPRGSLFSMRAGRELAGLRLPRHRCCGGCCLPCPLVTCSRCSHNSVRGGGGGPPRGVNPFFFL